MIFYFKYMLLLFASISFWASNTDDIKPKIEIVSPVEGTEIVRGKAIKISAVLSDNIALEDYEVKITKGGTNDLRFAKSFSCNHLINASVDADGNPLPIINGKLNATISFNIGVAKDACVGDYYFSLLVKDKAGNKHIKKRSFTLTRF